MTKNTLAYTQKYILIIKVLLNWSLVFLSQKNTEDFYNKFPYNNYSYNIFCYGKLCYNNFQPNNFQPNNFRPNNFNSNNFL